jgi:surface polysaccharide O-acyltransferase-like enzyme
MSSDTLTKPGHQPSLIAALPSESGARPAQGARSGLAWMDLLRIGAIVAVVIIHAVSSATKASGTGWHPAAWWAANLLNTACLWCVPVFVMVSGALLLDPAKRVTSSDFLRRRAVRIGVPLVFWIGVYLVFQRQFYGEDLSVGTTVKAVASGDPFLQLYFLFIVAGLTALTPVLRKLIEHSSRRELYWMTGAALGFGLVEHAFRELGGGGGFNAITRFLPYVGYYLAGYVLRTAEVTEWTQRLSRRLFLAGWLATAIGSGALAARYGWTANGYFLYDYLSPTVMVMSLAAFAAARSWQPVRLSDQRLRQFGGATFGVFLIHPLLLFPIMRSLNLPDGSDIGRTVSWAVPLAVGVCLVAGGIALVVARIPGLRRLLC